MKKYLLTILSCLAAFIGAQAQITFETKDYSSIGVYDFWEESPFRTGRLTGNCAVVDNPFIDEGNDSQKVLGCQRSLYGSNLYGARIDLLPEQRFELTPTPKYVHVMLHKPVEGRALVIALGKHTTEEWAHQKSDVVQATMLSLRTPSADKWNDVVFAIKGAGNIEIYSLVIVFDCESTHRLTAPFVAYLDDIEVNSSSTPRVSLSGDYPISFDETQKSTHNTTRHLSAVKAVIDGTTKSVSTGVTSTNKLIYTSNFKSRFAGKPGDTVQPTVTYNGDWMHAYMYLDRNNDGQFSTELEADGRPAAGSDVMTYSYYAGKNSAGASASNNTLSMPSFKIPADLAPGFYRLRTKVDWDCIDPAGNYDSSNLIYNNGGNIFDCLLNVHNEKVTVNNNQRNGTVVAADGTMLSEYAHPFGTELKVRLIPENGFKNGGMYVTHGYHLQGDSLVHGNPQYFREYYAPSKFDADGMFTIPASIIDGDILIEGVMVSTGSSVDPVDPVTPTEGYSPVVIASGFNSDCIYGGDEEGPTARGPLDTHSSNLVAEYEGMPEATVLPANLLITPNMGEKEQVFQFADANGLNCLTLTKDADYWTHSSDATTGTLVFDKPVQAKQFALATVGANKERYDLKYTTTLNYTDGSKSSPVTHSVTDWGQGPANDCFYSSNARWRYTYNSNDPENVHFEKGGPFYLTEQIIDADASKAVASITCDYAITTKDEWGWGYVNIFAVSAIDMMPAGISTIPADSKADDAYYDISGRRVTHPLQGLYISNGRKVMVRP